MERILSLFASLEVSDEENLIYDFCLFFFDTSVLCFFYGILITSFYKLVSYLLIASALILLLLSPFSVTLL